MRWRDELTSLRIDGWMETPNLDFLCSSVDVHHGFESRANNWLVLQNSNLKTERTVHWKRRKEVVDRINEVWTIDIHKIIAITTTTISCRAAHFGRPVSRNWSEFLKAKFALRRAKPISLLSWFQQFIPAEVFSWEPWYSHRDDQWYQGYYGV